MASKAFALVVLLLATVLSTSVDAAPAQIPAECEQVAFSVMYCTSYIIAGGNLTEPDSRCCPGVQEVMGANPSCLCPSLVLEQEMGFQLDMTRALALPTLCRVETQSSIVDCTASTTSPSPSPSSSPPTPAPTPELPETPPADAPKSSSVPAPSAPPVKPTPAASPKPAWKAPPAPAPRAKPGKSGAGDLSVPVMAILVALAVAVLSHMEY